MKAVHRFLVLSLGVILVIGLAPAQITSTGSGSWSSTIPDAPWEGGTVPTSTDNVIIEAADSVYLDDATAACLDLTVHGKLVYRNDGTQVQFTVNGNLTVSPTGVFKTVARTPTGAFVDHWLTLYGNLTNQDTLDFRGGSNTDSSSTGVFLIFGGNTSSTVTLANTAYISSMEEFNAIRINKTAGARVILSSGNLFQSNNSSRGASALLFTSGSIETQGSSKWVFLATTAAAINGADSTKCVIGTLGRGTSTSAGAERIFDVADANGNYRPFKARTTTGIASGGYVAVTAIAGNADNSSTLDVAIDKVSTVRYYKVEMFQGTGATTNTNYDRFLPSYHWDDGVVASNTLLRGAYSIDNRANWVMQPQASTHTTSLGATPTYFSGALMAPVLNVASGATVYVAIANATGGANPLPVQLTGFTAASDMRGATLSWKTATETNNAGFEVERRAIANFDHSASLEAGSPIANYAKIGFVAGSGTSTSEQSYSFTDNVAPGRYAYRLKQIDRNGASTLSGEVEVEIGLAPRALTLGSYPNPFNPTTVIDFTLPDDGIVTLRVFNLLGQEVATLFNGQATGGRLYQVPFDASRLMSGVYVARLESGQFHAATKLTVMK